MVENCQPAAPCAPPAKPPFFRRIAANWQPFVLLAIMGLVAWGIVAEASDGYRWQWYRVWRYIGVIDEGVFIPGPLIEGLFVTLQLTAASLSLALPIGVLIAAMRLSHSPSARLIGGLVLGVVRNTPLLMQLFMVYFVLAPVFGLSPFAAATLSLALFEGVYMAEIFRAGVVSLPRSQWEAAYSLGMGTATAARLVILPQALRRVLAPLANQVVSLIKDTSLVSAIAVADLTMRGRVVITDTFLSFEIWLVVAAAYLCLTLMASIPARWLERHTALRT